MATQRVFCEVESKSCRNEHLLGPGKLLCSKLT